MTTRAKIEALIKRLEEATEGDSALDRAIRDCLSLPAMLVPPDGGDEAHPYTTSVDAALSLVPRRMQWVVRYTGVYLAELYTGEFWHRHQAPTAPLALCIAALRARLFSMKDDANG